MIQRYAHQVRFFINGSWTSFSNIFCVWFFKKNISQVYSINWAHFIVWLPLLLDVLGNMDIVIIFCLVFEVIIFEINRRFLIKSLFCITKKSGQKCKYLKDEKSFRNKLKSIFHHFWRVFIEKNFKKFGWWESDFNLTIS